MEEIKTKVCTKCKEEKEITEFHKRKRGKYGVREVCRVCRAKANYRPKPDYSNIKEKRCSTCGTVRTVDMFQKNKKHSTGYTSACKLCDRERMKRLVNKRKDNYIVVKYKKCTKCNNLLPITGFSKQSRSIDGHTTICKNCMKNMNEKRLKKYALNNYKVEYTSKICSSCFVEKPLEEFYVSRNSIDGKGPRCKTCTDVINKQHVEENKEYITEYKSKWQTENREQINQNIRNKRKTNPEFRITSVLRNKVSKIFRQNKRSYSLEKLMGCPSGELVSYIENKFTKGMSWDTYGIGEGKWVIDHIRPINSFDKSDLEQMKVCWSYLNFQPLWWKDNRHKWDKWDGKQIGQKEYLEMFPDQIDTLRLPSDKKWWYED